MKNKIVYKKHSWNWNSKVFYCEIIILIILQLVETNKSICVACVEALNIVSVSTPLYLERNIWIIGFKISLFLFRMFQSPFYFVLVFLTTSLMISPFYYLQLWNHDTQVVNRMHASGAVIEFLTSLRNSFLESNDINFAYYVQNHLAIIKLKLSCW